MGIKFKAIIIIVSAFLILLVAEYVIMTVFFMNNVETQEENAVKSENKRAEYMINQFKTNLEASVRDYAPWDDTYKFIHDNDTQYLDVNFSEESMENLKINIVVFYNKNNEMKYIFGYDAASQSKVEIPNNIKAVFQKISTIVCKQKDVKSAFSGIVKLDAGALLIASAPITDSLQQQPAGGTILFSRYLDANIVNSIEEITNSSIAILDINKIDLKGDKIFSDNLKDKILKSSEAYIISNNKEKVTGYSFLKGIDNEPTLILENVMERSIYASGKKAIYFFELISVLAFGIITIIIIILFQNNIIFPIVQLNRNLTNLDFDNIKSNKSTFKGKDEIEALSYEINEMLIKMKQKKEMEKELAYLSYYDKLTGLYNRGYFEYLLDKKILNNEYPFTLIIGDINGLKITNDTFGHTAGDEIICAIANVLKDACADEDIVSRWGGDEFAIILANSEDEFTEEICNNIREKCSTESKGLIALNISLGYSTITNNSKNIQDVIKEAEERMYRNKLFENKSARNSIISSLQRALAEKSNETEEHTNRLYESCIKVGKKMNMSKAKVDELELLAFLHDIGKIAIPDYILNKPGKLTEQEWDIMKTHTEIGYRIASATHELSHIAYAILTHHEHYDGAGYPKGLKSIEIPIVSRIISILDAYDVMTHERLYKDAMTTQEALDELRRCSGTQFDPEMLEICIKVLEEDLK